MIDPKLNVASPVPVDSAPGKAKDKEAADRLQKVSAGLSVNDTVAANANLSTGGRGVETSGVSSGSGAGAGMTKVTSGRSVSEVVPDSRGSGTTSLGSSNTQAARANFPDTSNDTSAMNGFAESEVSALAYQAWCERGCPIGSPEVDWETAVEQLRGKRARGASA